jgi:hypothetical protein
MTIQLLEYGIGSADIFNGFLLLYLIARDNATVFLRGRAI